MASDANNFLSASDYSQVCVMRERERLGDIRKTTAETKCTAGLTHVRYFI